MWENKKWERKAERMEENTCPEQNDTDHTIFFVQVLYLLVDTNVFSESHITCNNQIVQQGCRLEAMITRMES